jgi:hypothetical protein
MATRRRSGRRKSVASSRKSSRKLTVNQQLLDQTISRALDLESLKKGQARKILAALNKDTYPKILAAVGKLEALEIEDWGGVVRGGNKEYQRILAEIRGIIEDAADKTISTMSTDMNKFARMETQWQSAVLKDALPVSLRFDRVSPTLLKAIQTNRPANGHLMNDWYKETYDALDREVVQAIQNGIANGDSVQEIVRALRGTRSKRFKDGLLDKSRRHTEALVRTNVTHTSSQARELTYEAVNNGTMGDLHGNRKTPQVPLIKGILWVSTLDTRTSLICAGLDGTLFPVGEGERPPAHVSCRSTTVPQTASWKELGIDLGEAPEGTRASMDGKVAKSVTYGDWLKDQSAARQVEVLGKSRAKAFRAGEVKIGQFTNDRLQTKTLDKLGIDVQRGKRKSA